MSRSPIHAEVSINLRRCSTIPLLCHPDRSAVEGSAVSFCGRTDGTETFVREPGRTADPSASLGGCDFFDFFRSFSGRKVLKSMRRLSILGVLRLRAVSPLLSDRSARRFAQDDDSVGELTVRRPLCGSRGALQIPPLRSPRISCRGWWRWRTSCGFLKESRTRGLIQRSVAGNPGTLRSG
jgi:hypothetical protein